MRGRVATKGDGVSEILSSEHGTGLWSSAELAHVSRRPYWGGDGAQRRHWPRLPWTSAARLACVLPGARRSHTKRQALVNASTELTGIGNAIVDVIARCDDSLLAERGLDKGIMRLIDADEAERLYAAMGPGLEMSGGSAGNTMAAFASLGGRGRFVGKVRDDQLGSVFGHDIRAAGVAFTTRPSTSGSPTARSLILVTPDAQRTMNTYLGACVSLGPDDIDEAEIRGSGMVYLEGYLFDPPEAQAAFRKAAGITHRAGGKVALTLSDPFCVGRHRAAFRSLVKDEVDILFANQAELLALFETESFEDALAQARAEVAVLAVTQSEQGSTLARGDELVQVPAEPVAVVDTTGAGDAYAAGVLFGLARGLSLGDAGRVGSIVAAEAISHVGARPVVRLDALVAERFGRVVG